METNFKKVVLAYSGGLDTSIIIRWLKNKYDCEVIAYSADLGQGKDLKPLKKKALMTGASKIYIEDLQEEFIRDYAFKALKADAVYENKYLLATALSRPLIAKRLVEIANKEKADTVSHGSTGKGNDQVRFEASFYALDPSLKQLTPVREWEFKSREEEIDYAHKHKIPIDITKKSPYSIDINLWGRSIECGILEDPYQEPPEEIYYLTKSIDKAQSRPEYVEISFKKGVPVAINGKKYSPAALVSELNKIAGRNGVGRVDMVENRLVGIKSREIYELPAATVLFTAHRELEALTLDRETVHYKQILSAKYSELIYYGLWFSKLRESLDRFFDELAEDVEGDVKLKLYKGNCMIAGRKSAKSLYNVKLATYEKGDSFSHSSAKGFIELFSLPLKVRALSRKKTGKKQ